MKPNFEKTVGSVSKGTKGSLEELVPNFQKDTVSDVAFLCRWYGFFQESVSERADENARYRHVYIMYFMEDGTVGGLFFFLMFIELYFFVLHI